MKRIKLKDIESSIKGNYSDLQERQKFKNNKNIKVMVTNKWILNLVETILTTIKLFIAFFTFLTIISWVSLDAKVLYVLKMITLTLTITFAVGNLLTTLIDKILIRMKLKDIWGKNRKIEGEYIIQKGLSSKVNVKTKGSMSTNFSINYNNKINVFDNKLRISIDELLPKGKKKKDDQKLDDSNEIEFENSNKWNILKSTIDVKNNIFFIEFRKGSETINVEIDLKNSVANWYGKIPNNMDYGYWKWV